MRSASASVLLVSCLLLLPACSRQEARPHGVDDGLVLVEGNPSETSDECRLPCFTVAVVEAEFPAEGRLVEARSEPPGLAIPPVETDEHGRAEFCPQPGSIPPGATRLLLSAGDLELAVGVDVRPFGWDLGREREVGAPEALAFLRSFSHPTEPILAPREGTWFAHQVTDPSLLGDSLLTFSGTEVDNGTSAPNAYQIGLAHMEDGRVVELPESPLAPAVEGAWDELGRNAPNLVSFEGRLLLYYHGLLTPEGGLAIGRLLSEDGERFEPDVSNPILEPDGEPGSRDGLVGHPALLIGEDGLLEMWYASGAALGMALSSDGGVSFTPYCLGPVLDAEPQRLKTPELLWKEDRYLMTFARGTEHAYEIGWAESFDGLRWALAEESVLGPGVQAWDSRSIVNAQILDGDALRLLFAGVGHAGSGIGIAEAHP